MGVQQEQEAAGESGEDPAEPNGPAELAGAGGEGAYDDGAGEATEEGGEEEGSGGEGAAGADGEEVEGEVVEGGEELLSSSQSRPSTSIATSKGE